MCACFATASNKMFATTTTTNTTNTTNEWPDTGSQLSTALSNVTVLSACL